MASTRFTLRVKSGDIFGYISSVEYVGVASSYVIDEAFVSQSVHCLLFSWVIIPNGVHRFTPR